MKKMFKNVKAKMNGALINIREAMKGNSGEGFVDTGVKIIISVVVGGVLMAGLYALFNDNIIPTLQTKITDLFGYTA